MGGRRLESGMSRNSLEPKARPNSLEKACDGQAIPACSPNISVFLLIWACSDTMDNPLRLAWDLDQHLPAHSHPADSLVRFVQLTNFQQCPNNTFQPSTNLEIGGPG